MDDIAQVHIAGPTLEYNGVRRQRCAWCGSLIDEIDLTTVSRSLTPGETHDDMKPWEPAAWRLGDEVAVEGAFPRASWRVDTRIEDDVPRAHENSCMRLDQEVTR